MDFDDARTIGQRVRQVRYARGKSLRVIAALAGISASHLSRIERGERALDRRSETVALASALQISPSEFDPSSGARTGQRVHGRRDPGSEARANGRDQRQGSSVGSP